MNKDTIVGIAGAAILVAAMAGVFWYEGTQASSETGSRSYAIAFAAAPVNGPGASDTASVGQEQTKAIRIAQGNLTAIEFTLLWTDDVGEPDTFSFEVVGPNGTTFKAGPEEKANDASKKGEIKLVVDLGQSVPAATTILADTPEQAQARAMARTASALGTGEWTVKVTLVQAQGALPSSVPGLPVQNPAQDTGNAWEVKTILTTWKAVAAEA